MIVLLWFLLSQCTLCFALWQRVLTIESTDTGLVGADVAIYEERIVLTRSEENGGNRSVAAAIYDPTGESWFNSVNLRVPLQPDDVVTNTLVDIRQGTVALAITFDGNRTDMYTFEYTDTWRFIRGFRAAVVVKSLALGVTDLYVGTTGIVVRYTRDDNDDWTLSLALRVNNPVTFGSDIAWGDDILVVGGQADAAFLFNTSGGDFAVSATVNLTEILTGIDQETNGSVAIANGIAFVAGIDPVPRQGVMLVEDGETTWTPLSVGATQVRRFAPLAAAENRFATKCFPSNTDQVELICIFERAGDGTFASTVTFDVPKTYVDDSDSLAMAGNTLVAGFPDKSGGSVVIFKDTIVRQKPVVGDDKDADSKLFADQDSDRGGLGRRRSIRGM